MTDDLAAPGDPDDDATEAPALIPAATVVVLRDGADGLETLLLRRNASLVFAGGMWVFPGGRIDPDDLVAATPLDRGGSSTQEGATRDTSTAPASAVPDEHGDDPDPGRTAAARRAAVREAAEEADLALDPAALVWFAHWTPPPITIKRYATWFFATPAPPDQREVTIDGGEILDHGWVRPADALARRNALEIELAPPTWITLEHLARHPDTATALAAMRAAPPEYFATRFVKVGDGAVAVYEGDVAYEDLDPDPDRAGGRHRLWMLGEGWRYERSDWT
jgi:8-oxo-dGTP pyrophosphatase MutT (NUDIX family)